MKEILKKSIIGGTTFFITVILLTTVYALTFPNTAPSGQTSGGAFMNYFNKMLVDTGSATDGTVKNSNKLGGQLASNYARNGTMQNGKICTYNSTTLQIDCNSDMPAPAPTTVNGVCGTSNGLALSSEPTTNLCTSGTASTVSTTGTWNWTWTCSGGGTPLGVIANCTAIKYLDTYFPGAGGAGICDTANITIGSQVWSACNVGTSTAGTITASYGLQYNFDDANNNLCPAGRHLPTQSEWQTAYNAGYSNQDITNPSNLANKLKLPLAGYTDYTGNQYKQGTYGFYWSSTYGTTFDTFAYNLRFNSTFLYPDSYLIRTFGFSVRCLKN